MFCFDEKGCCENEGQLSNRDSQNMLSTYLDHPRRALDERGG